MCITAMNACTRKREMHTRNAFKLSPVCTVGLAFCNNLVSVNMCACVFVADYQLTEEMFIKNLWVSVNQPDFKEKVTHLIYSPATNPT